MDLVHPYIPNSDPKIRKEMLEAIGVRKVSELFESIPGELQYAGEMNIPGPLDEYTLRRTISSTLGKNSSPDEFLSFLGAGCWPHFIPAICDEVSQRAEFVTAYAGEPYEDHGRFQALFEYQSLMGELLDMDVVNVPTFDWAQAAATSLRMASRVTKRQEVLLAGNLDPDKERIIRNYCSPDLICINVDWDESTGGINLEDLANRLSSRTAAVYVENPTYFGSVEENLEKIIGLAHEFGSLAVVGVDPISLGVLAPPSQFGADIVCGDLQPLGIHMNFGGGQSGFIATHDDEPLVMEFPSRLFGLVPTIVEGEYGFGDVAYERTSFALREKGKESVGTQTALWGIVAGVYLSVLGPKGLYEVDQAILLKSAYAREELNRIPGVSCTRIGGHKFKEFVVDFNETGMTVDEINRGLLRASIFGGVDLSAQFSQLGQCALYCVTEIYKKKDIDRLVDSIRKIVSK